MTRAKRWQSASAKSNREEYLSRIARAEIRRAIDEVRFHGFMRVIPAVIYPERDCCWVCGSHVVILMDDKVQKAEVGWCLDCGRTWRRRRDRLDSNDGPSHRHYESYDEDDDVCRRPKMPTDFVDEMGL